MKELGILDQFKGFLNTPDIFPEFNAKEIKTFDFPEIEITEKLKDDLKSMQHPRNSVLGKRMESFFEIAVKHSTRYDLIASNIQIIEEKRTIGELDFLLYDREKEIPVHVELVYKLYVYEDSFPKEKDRWIGPNRRDSFTEKMEKLKTRQFPILYKTETSKYLEKLQLDPQKIEQQLCFKAQLYSPQLTDLQPGKIINTDCLTGNWYTKKQFFSKDWNQNLFYSPQKRYWSCDPAVNTAWISHNELIETVESLFENEKAPLVWMKTGNSFHRFFIVWW